jgi:DNA invertase Pin-like site-specific DNA recombinase
VKATVYILASNDAELMRQQHAAIQYAQARGWPKPPSESWGSVASRPGEYLKETLSTFSAGDVLLIANVHSLAERPSAQERIVRDLIGRGVRIHCLELGDINAHLPGLFAAWASAADVERELDRATSDLAAAEERHAQDLKDFEETLYQRVMTEGVSIHIGANGHANSDVGDAIKSARAKRNLSLRQLGELAGVSHSQVQRLEQSGRGEGLEAVLSALGMESAA